MARDVYFGTARLPVNLSLVRGTGKGAVVILTSHVDLLIAKQRQAFGAMAGSRLTTASDNGTTELQSSVTSMIDGLLEKLLEDRNSIEVVSAADIAVPDDLTPPYVLWPIVPESRPGMLVAPSQTGKSTSALMMGYSVATGHVFIPRVEPRVEGPVVYIGQEESQQQWAARVNMVARGHKIEVPRHLYYLRLKGGSMIDSAELLAEQAAARKAVLIIVDSVQATWGSGGDNVREYASRWFNALEQIGIPILLIEHPNLENTRKPTGDMLAAGTSVKRDRVGHSWQLKSTSVPPAPDMPWRYYMTLTDVKRNYVSKQEDINYETLVYRHDWIRFNEAGPLTPDTIMEGGSKTDLSIANVMRQVDEEHDDGWLVKDIIDKLGFKDDRRTRQALKADYWRNADWAPHTKYRFTQVEGTGTHPVFNPAKWVVDVERAVEMSAAPGGTASAD